MVNAQEWLDQKYFKDGICQDRRSGMGFDGKEGWDNEGKRKEEIIKLCIIGEDLEGELSFKNFINLEMLICYQNQLNSLNLSDCKKLKAINCGYNQLTNLDLTGLNELEEVHCYSNQLNSLKFVRQLTRLKILDITGNNIATTDLQYLPLSLRGLACEAEMLSELARYGRSLIAWRQAHPELVTDNLSLTNLQLTEESNTPLAITAIPSYLLEDIKKKTEEKTSKKLLSKFTYANFAFRDPRPLAWERQIPEKATSLPLRLYNLSTGKVEATEGREDIPHYLALSYMWGTEEEETPQSYGQSYQTDLTKLGRKALNKVIATWKLINPNQEQNLNYIWIDNFCIDQKNSEKDENGQTEKDREVAKQKDYYNQATATLIAIDGEIEKGVNWENKNKLELVAHITRKIVTSPWFTRSWTFQEGLLSKQTIFMFDDAVVDGRELAGAWVGCQGGTSLTHSTIFSTPLGWSYGSTNKQEVKLSLSQVLAAIRHRQQKVALDSLYAILGLLPYGDKIKPKYKDNLCSDCKEQETKQKKSIICEHSEELRVKFPKYFQEELEQVLQELMNLAIKANPYETISWFGERSSDESWSLPKIKENGSTNVEDFMNITAQPQVLQITKQGISLVGGITIDYNYLLIWPSQEQIASDWEFKVEVPLEDTSLPIKISKVKESEIGRFSTKNNKIFIDMINKWVIKGEELIAQYHQQLPLVQEYAQKWKQVFSLVYDNRLYSKHYNELYEYDINRTIKNSLVWKITEQHYLVVDKQVQKVVNIWKEDIHSGFAKQALITAWIDNNWTYKQVKEWADELKDKFNPQDYSFYTWTRDVKNKTRREVKNNYTWLQIRYQAQQTIETKIEFLTKK